VHALLTRRRSARGGIVLVVGFAMLPACRQKISGAQCEALISRYAEIVVHERMPNAPLELVRATQKEVKDEAAGDEGFRNCTTEVGPKEFDCAMSATTPEAIEKCLLE
jgi:hypothetical protein